MKYLRKYLIVSTLVMLFLILAGCGSTKSIKTERQGNIVVDNKPGTGGKSFSILTITESLFDPNASTYDTTTIENMLSDGILKVWIKDDDTTGESAEIMAASHSHIDLTGFVLLAPNETEMIEEDFPQDIFYKNTYFRDGQIVHYYPYGYDQFDNTAVYYCDGDEIDDFDPVDITDTPFVVPWFAENNNNEMKYLAQYAAGEYRKHTYTIPKDGKVVIQYQEPYKNIAYRVIDGAEADFKERARENNGAWRDKNIRESIDMRANVTLNISLSIDWRD